MSILEFPDAISKAIMTVGNFFIWVNGVLYNIGWILTFFGLTITFFVIQLFFIYVYYRVILIALGFRPRIEQLLKRVDEMF